MLHRSPRNFECESGIQADQPTVTNTVGDSITVDVTGTNSDTEATGTDESDDVEDESDDVEVETDSDLWEEDSRYGFESWDEDESASREVWDSDMYSDGGIKDEGCHPTGFWDDDDDDDDDLDKNSEGEVSDQASNQQDVSTAPLMKRAKTSHVVAASPTPSTNVRKKTSLSLLPTMPLDILFEIFSHLSPTDILNLSRISKIFHQTLSSGKMSAVWKAVRKRISAPDGPDWMSEEAWAGLLFRNDCQSCRKSNADGVDVDFLLLKRICVSCRKRHCVSRSKVERLHPNFDFVILLVPSTDRPPWNIWNSRKNYYWNSDLDSMVSKLTALKQDADAQRLHCFMEERKRRLQCIRQNSSSWSGWYLQMMLDRDQEDRDNDKRRLQQIKDKFKELGYIDDDLDFLRSRKECRGPGKTQMTAKIWSRIRPLLEPEVKERKAHRLKKQLATIRNNRRRLLASRYEEFQRTLHPSQWRYLPRTLEITTIENFSRHIEDDAGVEVDGTTFDQAFLEFPALLAAMTEQRKTTLRALMDATPREDGEIGLDSIDLATAAFKCVEVHNFPHPFKYVFGWDEIASHHCLPDLERIDNRGSTLRTAPSELKYIPEIAIVVRKLAQLIGLDPVTATAADFDKKDKRFACEACFCTREQGRYLQIGYTWRNLAVHLETSKSHNSSLLITVLSDDAEDEMKQCERNDRKWDVNQWTCSHCPEYIGNLQHRQTIVEHLSASHGIQMPSEPTDLFFFERCRKDWTTRFLVPAMNPAKFRCLECVSKKDRLFMLNGVEAHLKAKHKIPFGQHGIHYALV